MKIRAGFVSNSSSSSFLINLNEITVAQYRLILENDYKDQGSSYEDAWSIEVRDDLLQATTWMDNYDMHEFLEKIGVQDSAIKWNEYFDQDWNDLD